MVCGGNRILANAATLIVPHALPARKTAKPQAALPEYAPAMMHTARPPRKDTRCNRLLTPKKHFVLGLCLTALSLFAANAFAVNNGEVPINTVDSARRMIEDLSSSFGDNYKQGNEFLKRLDDIETKLAANPQDREVTAALQTLLREAALANPLLDFDKLYVIRRQGEANRALNSHTSETIRRTGWNNEISEISNLRGEPAVRTIYKHRDGSVMKHIDVHFSGEKIMFSGIGKNGNWGVLEVDKNGRNLKELTPDDQSDVQWFDGCYLPEDDKLLTCSTAGMQGLPCENGGKAMTNLYRVDSKTKQVRQLTFEQDSDWHPRVMDDGRVMYLRWEYTDLPHYYSRILFEMNPDGTSQMEYWGSGSYFPTAFVWARPVPGKPSMAIGVVGGHHAKSETGRLMLIDRSLSRKYPLRVTPTEKTWGLEGGSVNIHPDVLPAEETGCVQEIPGYGRDVVGNVHDNQGGGQKYTFGTPWPLSEKYFLVSMRGAPGTNKWSLCLVDVFDNITVIYQDLQYDIFEPMPATPRTKPPVIVDRTTPGKSAMIFCTDIYDGRGLETIPHGTVKSLRVFAYHYGYIRSGGHESCGLEAGWDIKRILGTVPVEEDGSYCFKAPANTPIAMQPLDEDGAALALMRSWIVAMPGETLTCNGCHEELNEVTPPRRTLASQGRPAQFYGPARPFAYHTEVQPVLDKFCVGCHNEQDRNEKKMISFERSHPTNWRHDQSYLNLVAFVRRPGPESDMDLLNAMEYHASTSPLIQMLKKGHHGVELDREAWERLYAWIDLNVPHRGMWGNPGYEKRRYDLAQLYVGLQDNPEEEFRTTLAMVRQQEKPEPIIPAPQADPEPDGVSAAKFPFDAAKAKAMQGENAEMEVELADGLTMRLVRIPAGEFVMGSQVGYPDEAPRAVTRIGKPFWMGVTEVTNGQYRAFDANHDTRYIDEHGKDHSIPGHIANHSNQPVARIFWQQAMQFCDWLSKKSGKKVSLPTEAQWEWAARAGSDKQFFYGDADTDFSPHANLADASRRRQYVSFDGGSRLHRRRDYPENYLFPLRDDRFTDQWFIVDYVAQYEPNPWGLRHGGQRQRVDAQQLSAVSVPRQPGRRCRHPADEGLPWRLVARPPENGGQYRSPTVSVVPTSVQRWFSGDRGIDGGQGWSRGGAMRRRCSSLAFASPRWYAAHRSQTLPNEDIFYASVVARSCLSLRNSILHTGRSGRR